MIETNPFDTSLTVAGNETTDDQARAAAVTCAQHAVDVPELVKFLDMLGILEDVA